MAENTTGESLKREIGIRSLTLAILNNTVGTGIFVIPALIAENLGSAAIIAYLVCGVLIALIALCFAEIGSKTTISGGVYTYIEVAFGPFAGFVANNLYWFGGCIMSDAAISNGLADTLKVVFPIFNNEIYRAIFFFIIFGGLAFLNIRSLKNGLRFVEFATLAKLIPLILLVIIGVNYISTENLRWVSKPSISAVATSSLLLFFAFFGFETPLNNGGEIKNAKRTVPLAIFLAISLILVLYISIQIVTQGILGDSIVSNKDAPLAAVAGIIFGKSGAFLVILVTAISMLGILSGEIMSIPRILFAGARDGLLPKPLARVHPRFFTPHIAVLFYASLGFLFSITGGFKQLAVLSSASVMIIYLGVILATLKLRKKEEKTTEKGFRMPAGMLIPVLSMGGIFWLLSSLSNTEIMAIAVFIAIVSFPYVIFKQLKS